MMQLFFLQPRHWMFTWLAVLTAMLVFFLTACSRFSSISPDRDWVAEQEVVRLRRTNIDLTQFKCVAKIILSQPNHPSQSFRAAMAGRLTDHIRVDMFAPFGGSAGTFAGNGKHLFFVMHPSNEYYKKRFGDGNLHRAIKVDVTVEELLELMVGRIPMNDRFFAQYIQQNSEKEEDGTYLTFVDRLGKVRQRIFYNSSMKPIRSEWFDKNEKPIHSVTVQGLQTINGFVLPVHIYLFAESGRRVSLSLERYQANAPMDESLFTIIPPSS